MPDRAKFLLEVATAWRHKNLKRSACARIRRRWNQTMYWWRWSLPVQPWWAWLRLWPQQGKLKSSVWSKHGDTSPILIAEAPGKRPWLLHSWPYARADGEAQVSQVSQVLRPGTAAWFPAEGKRHDRDQASRRTAHWGWLYRNIKCCKSGGSRLPPASRTKIANSTARAKIIASSLSCTSYFSRLWNEGFILKPKKAAPIKGPKGEGIMGSGETRWLWLIPG